jgi:hypoxia up-regulated 1
MKSILLSTLLLALAQAAVIGIDLGTELMKISIIQPGKKLEIVENVQSSRSTPTLLAFTEEARLMGAEALSRASGKAEALVPFALRLLGRLYNDTQVQARLSQEFNPMELLETPDRLTFSVRVQGEVYTVEELLSMIFEMARKMSETFGRTLVRDCVVTVPSSFTRSQRILMMQTAQAAGLNVLALMHENTAAALYYGIDRQDSETAHFALFYNLGASRVQASVVKYTAWPGTGNKTIEHIEVLSHACNDQLGGRSFDALLASHIADEFERIHKINPRSSKKTMLRIMNHASKVKKVLSANKVAYVHDDSLYQGKALSYGVQREVLENMVTAKAKDLLRPVEEALFLANLTIANINSLEIIGGVSSIPKVQELLKAFNSNRDLGMHLNGDEAMAHGAALYAANFSHDLTVKPMWLSDVIPFAIRAEFWSPDDSSLAQNATVFTAGTHIRSQKELTLRFAKRT